MDLDLALGMATVELPEQRGHIQEGERLHDPQAQGVARTTPFSAAARSRVCSTEASVCRADGSSASPASVSATRRVSRSKSRTPSSCSSAWIETDSADCT
jgi:hypothetical protein